MIKKIRDLQEDIKRNNSVRADDEKKLDVNQLMKDLKIAVDELLQLKLSIFEASRPIRENILRISEAKSEIAFLKGIDTQEGKQYVYGADEPTNFEVTYDMLWVRDAIKKCEETIDNLQDEIDIFNHKTELVINKK